MFDPKSVALSTSLQILLVGAEYTAIQHPSDLMSKVIRINGYG
jgi:hypothetical protein